VAQLTRVGDLTVLVERPTSPTTKPPVVLIHGFNGGAWFWENYQPMLARHGYESHAINLRGHHGSRPVRDIGKVPVHDYVQDALEVARSLADGRGRPIVIGHSMGGLIAQKVAEAGACSAAVFISSAPPRWIPIVSWLLVKKQMKYARQIFFFEPILPSRGDADDLMFNRTPLPDRDVQFARLVPESGRAGFDLSFGTVAVRESRVTAPTLVVTGTDDHFVAPRVARALARKYKSQLREYDTFAHHIITEPGWEKPCSDIIQWMDQNARA
jgi:non-heme chloroperoxidase